MADSLEKEGRRPLDVSDVVLEAALREDYRQAVTTAGSKMAALRAVRELLDRDYPQISTETQRVPLREDPADRPLIRPTHVTGFRASEQFRVASDIVDLILGNGSSK